jgi:hypothetical protein
VVSFQLRNPADNQAGKIPRARATGNVSIPWTYMEMSDRTPANVLMTDTETKRALVKGGSYLETAAAVVPSQNMSELTVEFWMKVETKAAATGFFLIEASPDTPAASLRIKVTDTIVQLQVGGTEATSGITIPTEAGSRSSWYHYALSWRGSDGVLAYYLNGEPVTTSDTIAPAGNVQTMTGILRLGDSTNAAEFSIAEVRLWGTVRSAAAIKAQYLKFYQAGRLPASLIAYYTLTGCTATGCKDDSVYNNSLVFGGAATLADNVLPMVATVTSHFLDEFVYEAPKFTVITATQSSDHPGGDNCITISFAVNVDVGRSARITVTGLKGSQTPTGVVLMASSGTSSQLFKHGKFDQKEGTLETELDSPLPGGVTVTMTVSLINSAYPQDAQYLTILIRDGAIDSIGESLTLPGPKKVLGDGVLLVRKTPTATCVDVGPEWENTSLPQNETCPSFASYAHVQTCSVACPSASFKRYMVYEDKWYAAASANESSVPSTANADNTITFSLQPDRTLIKGSILTVTGLVGTQSPSKTASDGCAISDRCFLQVGGKDAASFVLTEGSWENVPSPSSVGDLTNASAVLKLTLAADMAPDRPFQFSIVLQNSLVQVSPQGGIVPSIQVSGPVLVKKVPMCVSPQLLDVRSSARLFEVPKVTETTCASCRLVSWSFACSCL